MLFRLLELNTCGVSQSIKLVFLYYHTKRPKTSQNIDAQRKETLFLQTQNVSDKIKNEILPLLQDVDQDIDELDDEVAMISNKKGNEGGSTTPNKNDSQIITADDIKIEIKGGEVRKGNFKANE